MKQAVLILFLLYSLGSCFKKEEPITLPIGNSVITSFYLGLGYEKEMFFDLSTNTYQERKWADWDIRFESSKDGYGVFINTGKNYAVRKIITFHLDEPNSTDTISIKKHAELVEPPEGKASISAMGDWQSYTYPEPPNVILHGIYVIELKNNSGYGGFKRLQILGVNDSCYYVVIADLKDSSGKDIKKGDTLEIKKNDKQNFTYFSFKSGVIDNAEPDKSSWDFVFTRYKQWVWYGPISGVLSNTNKVEVARDSAVTDFEDIEANSINKYQFSTNRNVIGYDWKTWINFSYFIAPKLTFIIKDTDGFYYKLRFLDYYDLGVKGNPKFEFICIK